jgi:hypothetical protein
MGKYHYRVIIGNYKNYDTDLDIFANVWVYADNIGDAFEQAVAKIVKNGKGYWKAEDCEYLKAIKLSKTEECEDL